MRHLHPRTDEIAVQIDDQRQVLLPFGRGPADEAVAGCELPGCGAQAEGGHDSLAGPGQVAQLRAGQDDGAAVVVAGHEIVPEDALIRAAYGLQPDRTELRQGHGDRGTRVRGGTEGA